MTKISVAAAGATNDIEVAKFLHQCFKMSLIGSQKKLAMGEKGFFYTCDLYGNDHVQREKEVRDIISFKQKNIGLLVLEIDDDQSWGDLDMTDLNHYAISSEELLNVLDSSSGLYQ